MTNEVPSMEELEAMVRGLVGENLKNYKDLDAAEQKQTEKYFSLLADLATERMKLRGKELAANDEDLSDLTERFKTFAKENKSGEKS